MLGGAKYERLILIIILSFSNWRGRFHHKRRVIMRIDKITSKIYSAEGDYCYIINKGFIHVLCY